MENVVKLEKVKLQGAIAIAPSATSRGDSQLSRAPSLADLIGRNRFLINFFASLRGGSGHNSRALPRE
jgi:hypothetical protein